MSEDVCRKLSAVSLIFTSLIKPSEPKISIFLVLIVFICWDTKYWVSVQCSDFSEPDDLRLSAALSCQVCASSRSLSRQVCASASSFGVTVKLSYVGFCGLGTGGTAGGVRVLKGFSKSGLIRIRQYLVEGLDVSDSRSLVGLSLWILLDVSVKVRLGRGSADRVRPSHTAWIEVDSIKYNL